MPPLRLVQAIMEKPSIVIVDDHAGIRTHARRVLKSVCHVLGEAEDGPAALALVDAARPAMVLLDIQMPGMTGIEVAAELRRRPYATRILIYSSDTNRMHLFPLLAHGIDGYITKEDTPAVMRHFVERVAAGEKFAVSATPHAWLHTLAGSSEPPALPPLDEVVLWYIARGYSNAEIARVTEQSEAMVATIEQRLYTALDVAQRNDAVAQAWIRGYAQQPLRVGSTLSE